MGKRNQGLSTAVQAAKEKRQQFITAFERCDSYEQLQSALSKYEKQKEGSSFVIPKKLKPGQANDINELDFRIKQLIGSKTIEFPPPAKELTGVSNELSSAPLELEVNDPTKEGSSSQSDEIQIDDASPRPHSTLDKHEIDVHASTLSDTHKAPSQKPTFDRRDSHRKKDEVKKQLSSKLRPLFDQTKHPQGLVASKTNPLRTQNPADIHGAVKENPNTVGLSHIGQTDKTNQPSSMRGLRANTLHPDKVVPTSKAVDSKTMKQRKRDIVAVSRKLVDINEKYKEFAKEFKKNSEESKRQRKAGNMERAQEFKKTAKAYKKAAKAAENIFDAIDALSKQYIQDGDLKAFKSQGKAILNEEKDDVKELQNHRGCKLIVINLLALICSAGIAHLGYSIYKGGFSLFHPATDAQNKVEDLQEAFNTLNVGA